MTTKEILPPNDASRQDFDAVVAPCSGELTVSLHYGNDADTLLPYMRDSKVLIGGEVTVKISGPIRREETTNTGEVTFSNIPCGHYMIETLFTGTDALVERALLEVGSRRWAFRKKVKSFDGKMSMRSGTNKCNFFVYDMIEQVYGSSPAYTYARRLSWLRGDNTVPALARHWAEEDNSESDPTPEWHNIQFRNGRNPVSPGSILAIESESALASGHVGIIAYPENGQGLAQVTNACHHTVVIMQGRTISANSEQVVNNDWGFRTSVNDGQNSINYPSAGVEVKIEEGE